MRNKIVIGLTTAVTAAAIAAPAAQAQSTTPTPAPSAGTPTVHINNCTVRKDVSDKTYTTAACSIVATNAPSKGITVNYKSSMQAFNPHTNGTFRPTSGKIAVSGIYGVQFAFKGKTPAQVRKYLKVTISNPTGGAVITDGTAVVKGSTQN